jgi:hypothetical protein
MPVVASSRYKCRPKERNSSMHKPIRHKRSRKCSTVAQKVHSAHTKCPMYRHGVARTSRTDTASCESPRCSICCAVGRHSRALTAQNSLTKNQTEINVEARHYTHKTRNTALTCTLQDAVGKNTHTSSDQQHILQMSPARPMQDQVAAITGQPTANKHHAAVRCRLS